MLWPHVEIKFEDRFFGKTIQEKIERLGSDIEKLKDLKLKNEKMKKDSAWISREIQTKAIDRGNLKKLLRLK